MVFLYAYYTILSVWYISQVTKIIYHHNSTASGKCYTLMDICRLHSHVPIMHCDHKHIKSNYCIFFTKNKVQDCFTLHLINSRVPAYSVLHPVYFLSFLPFGKSLQLSVPSDPSTSPCTHYNVQVPLSHYQI